MVHVAGFSERGYLMLQEYISEGCYNPQHFRPLDPLEEQLQRIEREGCPATEPQPQTA